MHVNLDYSISLHPKKVILPTFSGRTQLFQCKKQETRTNNLHHHKAGSVAGFLSLRLMVHHIQNKNSALRRWPPNIHCILQGVIQCLSEGKNLINCQFTLGHTYKGIYKELTDNFEVYFESTLQLLIVQLHFISRLLT